MEYSTGFIQLGGRVVTVLPHLGRCRGAWWTGPARAAKFFGNLSRKIESDVKLGSVKLKTFPGGQTRRKPGTQSHGSKVLTLGAMTAGLQGMSATAGILFFVRFFVLKVNRGMVTMHAKSVTVCGPIRF